MVIILLLVSKVFIKELMKIIIVLETMIKKTHKSLPTITIIALFSYHYEKKQHKYITMKIHIEYIHKVLKLHTNKIKAL